MEIPYYTALVLGAAWQVYARRQQTIETDYEDLEYDAPYPSDSEPGYDDEYYDDDELAEDEDYYDAEYEVVGESDDDYEDAEFEPVAENPDADLNADQSDATYGNADQRSTDTH